MLNQFESKPTDYQGVCYQVVGTEKDYRFRLRLPNGGRLITSESFTSVVAANAAARQRITLAVAVLGVKSCQ